MVVCSYGLDKISSQQQRPWHGRFYPIYIPKIYEHSIFTCTCIFFFIYDTNREKAKFHYQKTYNIPFINIRTQPSVIYMKEHRPKFGLGHVKEFNFNIDRALITRSCFKSTKTDGCFILG